MIFSFKDFAMKKVVSFIGRQKYLSIQLDITNACNLACKHCYHPHHKNNGALNFEQWKQILDQYESLLKTLALEPSIIICGGEPFTSPLLFPLLDEINGRWRDIKLFVLTNGTRLTPENVLKLKTFDVTVQVSLDGSTAELHDSIRGKGSFEKSVSGIRLLREHKINTVLQAVLSQKTSMQVESFFSLARVLNVTAMNFTRLIPAGTGKAYADNNEMLSPEDLKSAMREIWQTSMRFKVKTNTDQPLYRLIDKKLGASGKFGYQGLVVDYKGNLKLTSRTDYILGNIFEHGFENLFLNHPLLKKVRDRSQSACGSCDHYSVCGGNRSMSYAVTGSFLTKDPSCWMSSTENVTQGGKNEIC